MAKKWVINASPLIVLAKTSQISLLPQIKPVLNQLIQVGFRVSPEVLSAVLQLANEHD